MASPAIAIYDRKNIVDNIERECLGTPGSSGVVIGAQKTGKTCLLNYVRSTAPQRRDTIFCFVDVYSLEAAGFSDDSFMRQFLSELQNCVLSQIETLGRLQAEWKGANTQPLLAQAEVLRISAQECESLQEANAQLQKLLERTDIIEPPQTFMVFTVLRRIGKRVVLIIDEFNRMLREPRFSNRLYAFLRGASTQGKILTLVSSPVHLMDPSLHGPEVEDTYDRLNLFNHYQMHFLEPFTQIEAEGFLDWLPSVDPPLTGEEKSYLYALGGGSPHFLKKSFSLFVENGRPKTKVERDRFESAPAGLQMEPDFHLLYGRCSREEKEVLTEIATNHSSTSPLVAKLEREGYIAKAAEGLQLFSRLFEAFARNLPKAPKPKKKIEFNQAPSETEIEVRDLTIVSDRFVSALGLARPEAAEIFTFEVINSSKAAINIRVACKVTDYSQATVRVYTVEPGKRRVSGYTFFRRPALRKLDNPVATNFDLQISAEKKDGELVLKKEQLGIVLLPPNNFLMAVLDQPSNQLKNYTWLIAAWVRRRGNKLQEILNAAAQRCELRGYDAPTGEEVAAYVQKQVNVLYDTLRDYGIQYQNSAQVYLNNPAHYMQQVRFPEESLLQQSANCLDMAVLFASLLLSCQIPPLILLVPGHALVGWKIPSNDFAFIQTTGISNMTFQDALKVGMEYFNPRRAACEKCLRSWTEVIEDPSDFSILLDIEEIFRKYRLIPV